MDLVLEAGTRGESYSTHKNSEKNDKFSKSRFDCQSAKKRGKTSE